MFCLNYTRRHLLIGWFLPTAINCVFMYPLCILCIFVSVFIFNFIFICLSRVWRDFILSIDTFHRLPTTNIGGVCMCLERSAFVAQSKDFNAVVRFARMPKRFCLLLTLTACSNCNFYRAMLAQSTVMRLLSSVCPSVRDDQVSWSHRLEFFENYFTAK